MQVLHLPAQVRLHPDCTPNPLPIIDVYGTGRVPKLKKDDASNKLVVASELQGDLTQVCDHQCHPADAN